MFPPMAGSRSGRFYPVQLPQDLVLGWQIFATVAPQYGIMLVAQSTRTPFIAKLKSGDERVGLRIGRRPRPIGCGGKPLELIKLHLDRN